MKEILEFVEMLMKLKDIKRTGWVLANVEDPESVADHSYSIAVLSYIFAKQLGLDENKAIKIALIHDMNEILTGDIATRMNEKEQVVDNITKHKLENENTKKILSLLPGKIQNETLDLWKDFNGLESKESQLVYNLDKLDYTIQAMFYKKNKRTKIELTNFLKTADRDIKMPEIRRLFEKIRNQMENM